MKKFALILLAGASLLGTTGIASAQYYYGGGYYGRPGPYYGDPYRGRYYDGGYYQRRGYASRWTRSIRQTRIVLPGWTGR